MKVYTSWEEVLVYMLPVLDLQSTALHPPKLMSLQKLYYRAELIPTVFTAVLNSDKNFKIF